MRDPRCDLHTSDLLPSARECRTMIPSAFRNGENAPVDYSHHYPAASDRLRRRILDLAARHGEITDYKEAQAATSAITMRHRPSDDEENTI